MDKDFSSVGTQYIICECGENFPNENFLSIHLANGHGEVDTFLCDVCPEAFTSNNLLLQHKLTHKMETKKPYLKTLKTYSGPQAKIPEKMKEEKKEVEKKPPVIKVQTLRKINSISLIQSLKAYGGFIKIEPEPEPPEAPAAEMPEPAPAPVKTEVEAEPEAEAEPEPGDTEIYYQCDVCNAIFYTEMDFNVHYQSEHALKQEPQTPTAEQILEQHLVTDHGHSAGVSAAVETVYYYECEIGKAKSVKSERREAATNENITDADQPTIEINTVKTLASTDNQDDTERPIDHSNDQHDTERQLDNLNTNAVKFEETKDSNPTNLDVTDSIESENKTDTDVITDLQLTDKHDLLKVTHIKKTTRRGRPKKIKGGRPPKVDVFADLPPGLTPSQTRKLVEERKKDIRKQQQKKAAEKYRMKNREARRIARAEYVKNYPDAHRKASAKYSKAHPEVNRRAGKKYAEKKRMEKIKNELEIKQEVFIKEEIEMEIECILGF